MTIDTNNLQVARLIPTSGIGGALEQERRATSALLAVMTAVDEFGRAVTQSVGAPRGAIRAYTEVPFKIQGREVRPDGLVTVTRGSRTWSALIEVKTARNDLRTDQVELYLDVAKEYRIDAVITVSNQFSTGDDDPPVQIDKRKTRTTRLHHFSWVDLITIAVREHDHRGVSDPDQAWILNELIAYLEHPNSGALSFDDMGEHWTSITSSARDGSLRASDKGLDDVARRWDELVHYLCLELERNLGVRVRRVTGRTESDPIQRRRNQAQQLVKEGNLDGVIRIPDTAGDLSLTADLAKRQVTTSVSVMAPEAARRLTPVNWLLRQLRECDERLRIDVRFTGKRTSTSNTLKALREDPSMALLDDASEPRAFEIVQVRDLGIGRRPGRNSFVDSIRSATTDFYDEVLGVIQPWQPSAPRPTEPREEPLPSQDKTSPLVKWLAQVQQGKAAT